MLFRSTNNDNVCFIIGGNLSIKDQFLIERNKFNGVMEPWEIIEYKRPSNYQFPLKGGNASNIGNNRILIFGGYSDKNMFSSCIFNLENLSIESVINMASKYFISINKSPCIFYNGEVRAVDEIHQIHKFNLEALKWDLSDLSQFKEI